MRSLEAREYHKLYNTSRWRAMRRAQLMAQPLCGRCWEQGVARAATVADHRVPHHGDPVLFWGGELRSLCSSCHSGAKQSEERRGYRTDVGNDGWPLDERHPANKPVARVLQ